MSLPLLRFDLNELFVFQIEFYDNISLSDAFVNIFIPGINGDVSYRPIPVEEVTEKVKRKIGNLSAANFVAQPCQDLFVSVKYGGEKLLSWGSKRLGTFSGLGPVVTDEGFCCELIPQIEIENQKLIGESLEEKCVMPGSKLGPNLGVNLVLDVESFNYGFYLQAAVGLKVVIHEPREKPVMSQMAIHVQPGGKI